MYRVVLKCLLIGDRSAVHAAKALWVVVMYTMNTHTYKAVGVCENWTYKALYLSSLGAKGTTISLWEMLVSLLKKCCCHKKCEMCCSLV